MILHKDEIRFSYFIYSEINLNKPDRRDRKNFSVDVMSSELQRIQKSPSDKL